MDERILKLSPEQYRELLWALEIARHLHMTLEGATHNIGTRKSERIEDALHAVLSQAAMFDAEELAEREGGVPLVAQHIEDDVHDALQRYDDLAFFDILAEELAEKEMAAKYSPAEAKKLGDAFETELETLVEKYDKHIEKDIDQFLVTKP